MSQESRAEEEGTQGWAEHTVVANLPRLFPGPPSSHAPLSDVPEPRTLIGLGVPPAPEPVRQLQAPVPQPELTAAPLAQLEEPRTVVGRAPSRVSAEQLLSRYSARSAEPPPEPPQTVENESVALPLRRSSFSRVATFVRDDFGRAPRIVRLLLPALPLLAAAATFLDVEPAAPAVARAVAVAATSPAPKAPPTPSPASALPASSLTVARRPGHTLASDAADAAARGDRAQAIAIYTQLAREEPSQPAYASAARILLREEARSRPPSGR